MKRFNVLQSLTVLFVFSLMVWGLVPSVVEGAVPQLINFQGILKDGSGNPVPDNSYSVTFIIYDAPTGGNVKWTETQSVSTTNGLFTVLLGSTTPVPDTVFYDSSRYLGMAVSPDPEMIPRQRLSSVGYSSVSSQWTSAGQNLFTLSGKVGIGESNPLNTLTIGSNGGFTSTGLFPGILMGTMDFQTKQILIGRDENNFVQLAYADEDPDTYARLLVEGNHPLYITTGGSLVLGTTANNPVELFTNSAARMHITGDGNVGIGTTGPTKKLEVAGSIKADTVFSNVLSSNSPLSLQAPAGTTRMHIDDVTGNVGIGTTAPNSRLEVAQFGIARTIVHQTGPTSSGVVALTLANGSTLFGATDKTYQFLNLGFGGSTADLAIQYWDGAAPNERLRIKSNGNIGIGTASPGVSNLLELSSTTKGFVLPRMTKTERDAIASPVAGMMVYQTDNTPGLRVYNGTNWMRFTETAD